ncbi:class I SAM-dependent methyltransferase [Zooshikella ganghwensis]|uniref:class I SAM-dependent methyltransferase n=1 Tax=Zooshikella ganghwensis TaxID=202772 RepID=UPI000420CBA4|nr:class I SAM-dependent methyltransferase [Zooshikella ganghwensis]
MKKFYYTKEKEFWETNRDSYYSVLSRKDEVEVMEWIGNFSRGDVLDIGGGSGAASKKLLNVSGIWIVCLDLSYAMLKHSGHTKVQADALLLPFKNNSFDLIIAAAFIHHLPGQECKLLKECYRVLRSSGRIIGYDPNGSCIQNKIFMSNNLLRLNVFSPDERPLDPLLLRDLSGEVGFSNFKKKYISFEYRQKTIFQIIQVLLIGPFAKWKLKKYFHRWFLWSMRKI